MDSVLKTALMNIPADVNADDFDASNPWSWIGGVVDMIRSVLSQFDLPPKEEIKATVSAMLNDLFERIDFPGPDTPYELLIRWAVLESVDRIYDSL